MAQRAEHQTQMAEVLSSVLNGLTFCYWIFLFSRSKASGANIIIIGNVVFYEKLECQDSEETIRLTSERFNVYEITTLYKMKISTSRKLFIENLVFMKLKITHAIYFCYFYSQNNLPNRDQSGNEIVLKSVNFQPKGTGSDIIAGYTNEFERNRFTFSGTHYHVYLELDSMEYSICIFCNCKISPLFSHLVSCWEMRYI